MSLVNYDSRFNRHEVKGAEMLYGEPVFIVGPHRTDVSFLLPEDLQSIAKTFAREAYANRDEPLDSNYLVTIDEGVRVR